MFTGIIEKTGTIQHIVKEAENIHITVRSDLASELKIDQSLAHDGVCLTVVSIDPANGLHTVTAIKETLDKTKLGQWQIGNKVNLERCLTLNARLDGHIVQGHVDSTATCVDIENQDGSWLFTFQYPDSKYLTVEKGSICVNGVSLTVVNSQENSFSVAIIPYTYQHTNFSQLERGSLVNLEFDILGKYLEKLTKKRNNI